MSLNPSLIRRKQDASIRQAANLARISMPTAKQKFSAPAPSCPATNRTEAMEGEGGDYLISLRKEGSRRSHSILRVALIAPGVRCKSWHCGLAHFRQSSFSPHVDPQQMSVVPCLFSTGREGAPVAAAKTERPLCVQKAIAQRRRIGRRGSSYA